MNPCQKPRIRTELLQVHRDLLQFFGEPRSMSYTDIAEKVGYSKRIVEIRTKELEMMGMVRGTRHPNKWATPNS
jgi:DNA-binding MarR family transcriptional regulator